MWEETLNYALKHAETLGAQYAEVRLHSYTYEIIKADNKVLKEFSKTFKLGIGVRVIYNDYVGFSATNSLKREDIIRAVEEAIISAKASGEKAQLADREVYKDKVRSRWRTDPTEIPDEDKVRIVLEANAAAMEIPTIKSSVTYLGIQKDRRIIIASDGAEIDYESVATGFLQMSVAFESGNMEKVHESESAMAGWEFIQSRDWTEFSTELSKLAAAAVKAKTPPPGKMRVIADPHLIGLILHEAFGHASEGDLVASGTSVLKGKVGEAIASPQVTIVDDGVVEGGYFVPYDDEGNRKVRTVIVDHGTLKQFLTGRLWAKKLGMPVTGNSRAQDYANPPIVRQTNLYMEGGDWKLDEMLEELKDGLYLLGRGAGGGQVDTGAGTFTFSVGPSRVVKNGELGELVRGVVVSGYILETLKGVEAVGKDVKVRMSVFGACGKEGQSVRVGHGGPHVMIKEITVGGR